MYTTRATPKTPTFMKDVKEISPVMDPQFGSRILQKVSRMTGWKGEGLFPGTVPVPMHKKNMNLLAKEEYVVSSKLDGTRYLMLIDGFQKVYFINRNGEVFHASNVQFPSTTSASMKTNQYFSDTLLDGEMIFRKMDNEAPKPMFSIFDVICVQGEIIRDYIFLQRLEKAKDIIKGRELAINLKMIQPQNESFSVDISTFLPVKDTRKVLQLQIPYETDGLVFMPTKRAYNYWPTLPGVNDDALKWKPGALNTVDFQLRIEKDKTGKRLGQLYVSEHDVPFSRIDLTPQLEDLNGKIIECSWQGGKWVLLRARWDRDMPNTYTTTKETMKSIEDAISEEELVNFIEM